MMREKTGPREDAVAQTVAFIVALAFFMGILGALLVATGDTPDSDGSEVQDAQNRLDAQRLADVLVGSPGIGWGTEGALDADAVERLGLQHPDGVRIDDDRLDALRGASYHADATNGKLDYEEALASLGLPLDNTLGFHIRMAPVGLQKTLLAADLSHIRTAYVGDWDLSSTTVTVDLGTDQMMVDQARALVAQSIGPGTQSERDVVDALGVSYDDLVDLNGLDVRVHNPVTGTTQPLRDALLDPSLMDGDLYPDSKQYLSAVQPSGKGLVEESIWEYDILIAGSTIDHESLTSANVKQPVADWTLAGGTLMVLGSGSQNFQWLQPLFSVGTTTVNAAPAAPDVSHPMLHEPHPLDWPSYDHFGLSWKLKDSGAVATHEKFQHIITSQDEDILAVSNEGAFGTGRVFLTSYRPGDIADSIAALEATNLVSNMVLFSDRAHLYLDYGPTPPPDAAVSAAVRTTQVLDEDLGMINIRMTILYWGV